MNVQELATLAECNANVKIILLNNGHLGLVRQQQALFYNGRFHASQFDVSPDFPAIARGFGIRGVELMAASDPRQCLIDEMRQVGPVLINVSVHPLANVLPMVPPGAANRDMIETVQEVAHA